MKNQSFQEYLNAKNSNSMKPIVKMDGDTVKASPNKPIGNKKGSYSNGKTPKKGSEKGLGEMGDSSLKYNPDTENPKGKAPAKLPTVEAIEKSERIVNEMLANPTIIEHVVKNIQKKGLLGALVAEVFTQKESTNHLAAIMSHESYGPKLCRNLNHAINEEVAAPYEDQLKGSSGESFDDEDTGGDPDEESDEPNGQDLDVDMEPEGGPNSDPMGGDDPMMGGDQPCPDCQGQCMGQDGQPCQSCGGSGMMPQDDGGQQDFDPSMDSDMMANPDMGQTAPAGASMPMMMQKFQKAMMRAYQKAMMGKH